MRLLPNQYLIPGVQFNAQNFPDNAGNQDKVLVVIGTLSSPITNGGLCPALQ